MPTHIYKTPQINGFCSSDSVRRGGRPGASSPGASVLAVAALVVSCSFGKPDAATGDGGDDRTLRRTLGLAALVAALAAAPSALWFGHHRAALGVGLNHYLTDQTLDSVDAAQKRQGGRQQGHQRGQQRRTHLRPARGRRVWQDKKTGGTPPEKRAGSERGDAEHRASGYRGILRRVRARERTEHSCGGRR